MSSSSGSGGVTSIPHTDKDLARPWTVPKGPFHVVPEYGFAKKISPGAQSYALLPGVTNPNSKTGVKNFKNDPIEARKRIEIDKLQKLVNITRIPELNPYTGEMINPTTAARTSRKRSTRKRRSSRKRRA